MAINISFNISEGTSNAGQACAHSDASSTSPFVELSKKYEELRAKHDELVRQMGDEIAPFPASGVDGFLSHFIIQLQFLRGDLAGKIVSLVMPPAAQTVSRSEPFVYQGAKANHRVSIPLPKRCTLSNTIAESDFISRPRNFFTEGAQTVWMQILNLDSRMNTEWGPIRIILGETLKREYPDVFQPSLGVAQALGAEGFPARLFFNPYAIIETPFGAFRAIHGTLSYGRIVSFPPVNTPVSICECIPLEDVQEVRAAGAQTAGPGKVQPFARIISLCHPIDTSMHISGNDAFEIIENMIDQGPKPLANR